MTSPKAIRDQIILTLKDTDPKNGVGQSIKKIFRGEPPLSRWPNPPWAWVEWVGGPMAPPIGAKAEIRDNFYIVVVDKHIDAEKAEDSIMDFAETIEDGLDNNVTLGGLVAASWVVNREKQKLFMGDYSTLVCRLTLSTRRRE